VVEAHGSLARALCTNPACEEPVIDMEHHVWEVVARGAVPYCPACGDGGRNETPPLPSLFCPLLTTISLRAAVRPDVVFFGEPLPRKFFELNLQDFKTCDLLIVMGWRPPLPPNQPIFLTPITSFLTGTSLTVYPFAGLVNEVPPTTPRLLINKTSVGVWTMLHDSSQYTEQGVPPPSAEPYRDVQVLGSCDAGIWQLASALGWDKELAGLMHASG
jgi:NAD-dependent SIR2 family protein deacetylase